MQSNKDNNDKKHYAELYGYTKKEWASRVEHFEYRGRPDYSMSAYYSIYDDEGED